MTARKIAKVVTRIKFGDPKKDSAYWKRRSRAARLQALDELRTEYHEWIGDAQLGFQRVVRIIKRQ